MNKFTPNDLPKAQHVQICIYVVGESHKYSGNFIEDLPGENVEVYRTPGIEQSLNLIKIKNKNIQSNIYHMIFASPNDFSSMSKAMQKNLDTIKKKSAIVLIACSGNERISEEPLNRGKYAYVLPLPFDYGEILQCVRREIEFTVYKSLAHFTHALLSGFGDAVMITDSEDSIVWVNDNFTTLTGYSLRDVRGKRPNFMRAGKNQDSILEEMWRVVKDVGVWRGEIWNRRKTGEVYAEWLSVCALIGASGKTNGYVSILADITERKTHEENLTRQAFHDVLTGLPNRLLLQDRFQLAVATSSHRPASIAVLFIDLDGFKAANDTYGHALGDQVLIQISERLVHVVGPKNTASRLGGDEFVCLLVEQKSVDDTQVKIDEVKKSISRPYEIDGVSIQLNCSIGVSNFPQDGDVLSQLISIADERMYNEKLLRPVK